MQPGSRTGNRRCHDYQWQISPWPRLGGEFWLAWQNHWTSRKLTGRKLMSTGKHGSLQLKIWSDWLMVAIYQEAAAGNALCQELIERMNRNLAQAIAQYPALTDPDVTSVRLYQSKSRFYPRRQKAADAFVETHEEYISRTSYPSLYSIMRCQSLWCPYWLQRKPRPLQDLSPNSEH